MSYYLLSTRSTYAKFVTAYDGVLLCIRMPTRLCALHKDVHRDMCIVSKALLTDLLSLSEVLVFDYSV